MRTDSVSYDDVEIICKRLASTDTSRITTRRVREEIGRGSLSTISKFVKEWQRTNTDEQRTVRGSNKTTLLRERPCTSTNDARRNKSTYVQNNVHRLPFPKSTPQKISVHKDCTESSVHQTVAQKHPVEETMSEFKVPTVPVFSELFEKISLLQQRVDNIETKPEPLGTIKQEDPAYPKHEPSAISEMPEKIVKLQKDVENLNAKFDSKLATSLVEQTVRPQLDAPVLKNVQYLNTEVPKNHPAVSLILKNQSEITSSQELKNNSSPARWENLFVLLSHPEPVLLGLFALILSSYLVHQNYIFFKTIETSTDSALTNAIISEIVLILTAASLAFTSKKVHRALIGAFLFATIAGLGIFFHKSISEELVSKSPQVEMLTKEKESADDAVEIHAESIKALSPQFVSRRQELQDKIDQERIKISNLNTRIEESKRLAISSSTNKITYAFWLRLVAMLLNAYLVHCFFKRLKRSWLLPAYS